MYSKGHSDFEIAQVLGKTKAGVAARRQNYLNLKSRNFWSDEENSILFNYYSKMSAEDISSKFLPNKSRNAIVHHAQILGLTGYRDYEFYSESDYQFIKDNYLTMSDSEMGEVLHRSKASIKNNRLKLKCYRQNPGFCNYENVTKFARGQIWSWKEQSMIACNYKCVATGEKFEVIHHLVGFNTIVKNVLREYYPDIIDDVDINTWKEEDRNLFAERIREEQAKYPLGVCLAKRVHEEFHNEYGRGDNTSEQFKHFINKNYPNNNFKIIMQ